MRLSIKYTGEYFLNVIKYEMREKMSDKLVCHLKYLEYVQYKLFIYIYIYLIKRVTLYLT